MIRSLTTLLCIGFLTAACSGGGGSASEGGIGGTGITRGVITSTANSATVAGTTYEDDSADVFLDGVPGVPGDLTVGMKVRVEGSRSPDGVTGTATRIDFDDEIEGPVDTITPHPNDPLKADLEILGQTVVIEDGFTLFDGVAFDTILEDDVVEVSGFRDGDGVITATWVELVSTDPTPVVELKGTVQNFDDSTPDAATFDLGSIQVVFDSTTPDDMVGTELPDGVPMDGDFVEVKGVFDGVDTVDATTAADRIELEGPEDGDVGDFEIEGIVSNFTSLGDFEVDGQPVVASGFGVRFEPANPGFVADGARIEVEGRLQDGVLIASEVKQRGGEVRIAAEIAAAPVAGVLTLLGAIQVEADSATRFDDECSLATFDSIDDLTVGDFVEVRAVRTGTTQVLATEIECRDPGTEIELRGRVQAFDGTSQHFTILGVQIPVNGGTSFNDFPDPLVSPPLDTPAEFFSFLVSNANALVEVRDTDDGDAAVLDAADAIEYEEDD